MSKITKTFNFPKSQYFSRLSTKISNCPLEANAYSECIMLRGLNVTHKECDKEYQLLMNCYKRLN